MKSEPIIITFVSPNKEQIANGLYNYVKETGYYLLCTNDGELKRAKKNNLKTITYKEIKKLDNSTSIITDIIPCNLASEVETWCRHIDKQFKYVLIPDEE